MNFKSVIGFVKDVFSDNGQPSFARVAAGFALLCSMRWVHYIVMKTGTIPDMTPILFLVGGLYGISRLASIFDAYVAAKTVATTTHDVSTTMTTTTPPTK